MCARRNQWRKSHATVVAKRMLGLLTELPPPIEAKSDALLLCIHTAAKEKVQ